MNEPMVGYEILEHTADVGLRARAATLGELVANATRGMAEIAGIWQPGDGEPTVISVEARDPAALLVDWLNEVLYLHDSSRSAIGGVSVDEASEKKLGGRVWLAPLREGSEGTQIKAATYHQMRVQHDENGWTAEVYFDV